MTHTILCGGIIRKCCISMIAATLSAFAAEATYVFKDTSRGDPRLVVANTTFSNVVDKAMSGGLWVRDIIPDSSNMNDPAAIFGCAHVNGGTDNGNGFVVMFSGRNSLKFNLFGKTGNGERKSYSNVLGTNDIGWCHDGKWHFIMFTCDCDKGEAKLYLDGTRLMTLTHDLATISPERSYAFGGGMGVKAESDGAKKDDYGAGWVGYFAEATVWNRALTDEEVDELATRRVKYDANGLIAYWPCNEASGNPVNWAAKVIKRADGKDVTAYARVVGYYDDPDFFSMPSGYFVVTPEYAAAHGYVMAADCPANTLAKPATNIQYALNKATANGSIVNLLPGIYYPTATMNIKCSSLVLRSYNPETDDYDRTGTVIDGSQLSSGNILSNNNGSDVYKTPEINSLTFCNTTAARGVYLKSAGAASVLNCSFTNLTHTTGIGGGVYLYTSNGTQVSNCLFNTCSATDGGGVYTIQNSESEDDFCTVQDCVFTNCKSNQGGSKSGGGVNAARNIHIYGCVFNDNSAAGGKGGHVYCGKYSMVVACSFGGSVAATHGGCLYADGGYSTIMNCRFVGATSGDGYGYIHPSSNTLITDCVATNNKYAADFVFAENVGGVVIRQCLFADNDSSSLVTGNKGTTRFENCTSLMTGAVCRRSGDWSTNTFVNCIFRGSVSNDGAHYNIISNCCVAAPAPGGVYDSVVITKDPKFADAEHGDYTLKHSSPARDRALFLPWITASMTDLAGDPRVVTDGKTLAENPNAKPDMGCYECLLEPLGLILVVR